MKRLSQAEIDGYRQDIRRHGVQGVIRMYADLLEKGYDYAGWAKGVAEADSMVLSPAPYSEAGFVVERVPRGTVTGRAAMLFMKDTAGQTLTSERIDNIRIGMAQGYLKFLEGNLNRPPRDVSFEEMRDFHLKVFERNKLSINNWTLETPMKLIGRYEGKAVQEQMWEKLRQTQGEGAGALFASMELYNIVRDYSDGRIQLNRQGRRIDANSGGGVLGLGMEASLGSVRSIDRADVNEAKQWMQDVSRFWPLIKAQANQHEMNHYAEQHAIQPDSQMTLSAGNDLLNQTKYLIDQLQSGNQQALRDFTALPEIQAAAARSQMEARQLLQQYPGLGEEMLPNRFNRPVLADMPPQVQKLYAESKEHLQAHYQEHGIRYGEETLENTAMALAADGYRNRMRSVTMMSFKDGQINIGDNTAPDFRMASVNVKEAGLTPSHESMVQAQQTEQDFALQAQQREMERMAENRSRGMSMG